MKSNSIPTLFTILTLVIPAQSNEATAARTDIGSEAFAKVFDQLKAEMTQARSVALKPHAEARSQKEHYDLSEKTSADYRAAAEPLVLRAVILARSQASVSNSMAVLQWVLSEQGDSPEAEPAGDLLMERHLADAMTLKLAQNNASSPRIWPQRVLRAMADMEQLPDSVRAQALFALAAGLQIRRDIEQNADLEARASEGFHELAATYPTLKHCDRTWSEIARAHLYELEHLTLGKQAPDIEGEDIDGVSFKLSDYRGKVVLLDFWGDWCGPCREIYTEGPALLRKFAGKPFDIVAVNSDGDRALLRRRIEEVGLTWRLFWDGGMIGGPIATAWNIQGWPMLYVIDHRGVIRAKYVRGSKLERIIAQCVDEAEAMQD